MRLILIACAWLLLCIPLAAHAGKCPKTTPPSTGLGVRPVKGGYCLYRTGYIPRVIAKDAVTAMGKRNVCLTTQVMASAWIPGKKRGYWARTPAAWCVDDRVVQRIIIRFRKRQRSSLD